MQIVVTRPPSYYSADVHRATLCRAEADIFGTAIREVDRVGAAPAEGSGRPAQIGLSALAS